MSKTQAYPFKEKQSSGLSAWLDKLTTRAHHNLAVVALANKLARIAWQYWPRERPIGLRCWQQLNPRRPEKTGLQFASRPGRLCKTQIKPPPGCNLWESRMRFPTLASPGGNELERVPRSRRLRHLHPPR